MAEPILLSRDEFRESVFERDGHLCVICSSLGKKTPAVDAHHIIERRLFGNGGYFLENGASVCEEHHLLCEQTKISVEEVRAAARITRIVVPEHLYADQPYDKWGNPVLANGTRLKGELFDDESVQKILGIGGVLNLFTNRVRYPRTYHLPWSHGLINDDRLMEDTTILREAREVVVTDKLDGENTTMYSDYVHARSLEYHPHPSRNWVKALHGRLAHDIPEGWRVCGENLYAKHSIGYDALPDYFLVFSVWNDKNFCLSWDETQEWAGLLGLKTVPVLYRGPFDEEKIRELYPEPRAEDREGYVVRITDRFHYRDFRRCAGKYVRERHVAPETHFWRNKPVVPNKVKKDSE